MAFEGFPLVVGWELTLECNLRCGHCASDAGVQRKGELGLDEALSLCEQFPALLVQEVDFTGGEPLLRSDWPKIAARLRDLGIPARMVTNGLLLKEKTPLLADEGIATVGVSIDGLEATHDRIRRRPGLFRNVVEGVEAALARGVPVGVITAVNDLNINQLPALFALIWDLGVRHWQLQPVFAFGRARGSVELTLSEPTFLELGRFIREYAARGGAEGFSLMTADGVGYFTELDVRSPSWKGCSAGKASCGITSDGRVKGCLSMPDNLVEGDLRKRDLWSIWFDDASFAYNRKFSVGALGKFCEGCEHGEQCGGGCAVMSYSSTGQFHNDPYCFYGISARRNRRINS